MMFLKVPHVIKIIDIINIWVLLSLSRTQWCLLKILISSQSLIIIISKFYSIMFLVCLLSSQSLIILISKFDSMMFLVCLLSSQSWIILISKVYSIMFLVCLLSSQSLIILINEFYSLYKTLWCVLRASYPDNHW